MAIVEEHGQSGSRALRTRTGGAGGREEEGRGSKGGKWGSKKAMQGLPGKTGWSADRCASLHN